MKNILFLMLSTLSIAACTKSDTFNTYDIQVGETIVHEKELSITIDSIIDSRCPTSVVCVWEGQAEVYFTGVKENDEVFNFTLIEREGHPGQADSILEGYLFKLLEVGPYPEDVPIEVDDYNIRLMIEGQ